MSFSTDMSFQPIEELSIPFDPTELSAKVQRRRRQLRGRIVSLVITALVLGALYAWQREQIAGTGYVTLYFVLLGISVAWCLGHLVAYLRAKKEAAGVGQGTALRIGRPGVELQGAFVPWPEVTSLSTVTGRFGRRPRFQLARVSGEPLSVPLNQMSVRPATLDLTARAYSAGRHGVDLTALDA